MNPTQIYQVCLLFVGLHLLALPAFVWAMRRRQFTMGDRSVYKVIDDTPDAVPVASETYPKWRLRLMLSVLCAAFMLMFGTTIMFIHASYASPPTAKEAARMQAVADAPAKCPFGFK